MKTRISIVVALIAVVLIVLFWNQCEDKTIHGVTICVTKDGWVIR